MATTNDRSVITCDLEGRLLTFSPGAEAIFGYTAAEVLGKARVSLFSPGLVVLGHVGAWLKAAREHGEHTTRTVFLRKDGTPFAADIRLTPTYTRGPEREKIHSGYCGVTTPLPHVDPADAMPPIGLGTRLLRWLVVTRAPFLTAALAPVLVAAAWVGTTTASPFPWGAFALALVGAAALHIASNVFNDYFDWRAGVDQANTDYFQPFSGGSRAIELGLVTEPGLVKIGVGALVVAALAAVPLVVSAGPWLLAFAAAGALLGYFYTAPPLRLVARRGLGELAIMLAFGPLLTAGTVFALTGTVAAADFLIGLPIGLLTTAILWINEVPDAPSDAATGKRTLVVVLGIENARWGYVALLVGAFGLLVAGVAAGLVPDGALLGLLALPLAARASLHLFRHLRDRELVQANALTIQLHLAAGALMALGLVVSG